MEKQWMNAIYSHFIESYDYNGILFEDLFFEWNTTWEEGIRRLIYLIERGDCIIQSSTLPFIIRNCIPTIEDSVKYLIELIKGKPTKYSQFKECAYPSNSYLIAHRSVEGLAPYDKFLALGGPHLQPKYFDLDVLNNYIDDPRYKLQLQDYYGSLSYDLKEDTKLDKKGYYELKTFGLGYDDNGIRVIVAFPRYLRYLSSSQQNHWESYEKTSQCKVSKPYLDNIEAGCFAFPQSIASGVLNERKYINDLWNTIFGDKLFLHDYKIEDLPAYYSFLFRPTTKDLNRFYLILDKLISDDLNLKHLKSLLQNGFDNFPPYNGDLDQIKGSLTALKTWIDHVYTLKGGTKIGEEIILPLKKVRQKRQPEAHKIMTENILNSENYKFQDDTLFSVYDSFCKLRSMLTSHPKAINVNPPSSWSKVVYKI